MEYYQVSSCRLLAQVKETTKTQARFKVCITWYKWEMFLIKPIPSVILASPVFRETQHGMWELTVDRDIFKNLKNCIDYLHGTLSLNSAVYLHRTPESFISISATDVGNCRDWVVPSKEMVPHTAHMMRHKPTEPDLSRALAGDTKMPEPVEQKSTSTIWLWSLFTLFFSLSLSLFYKLSSNTYNKRNITILTLDYIMDLLASL